ncbi:redoxin domain-containing protein [Pseudoclavibacter helvolus]|uniref:Alkyl hydroperoxide reductase subunit AhpC n=1 Tax=Pseudoclavibacter helvolus TaxID=255205 RepID=A0A7W4ULR9_9MICO|nr:redoxin domain-containing protein [Pseudoclavibacter helvolus]MBB2956723.1 alkyl hydroperoxide reductase subunit AhpC [Pseudoclavibacter helvolus]
MSKRAQPNIVTGEGLIVSEFAQPLESISLVDHRGGMRLVAGAAASARLVMFVPMAFTPVCADEIGTLVQLVAEAREAASAPPSFVQPEVLVVSTDTSATLRVWLHELGVASVVSGCSDFWPHGRAARAYDAFDESAGTATRKSFLVRPDGSYCLVASARPGEARGRSEHAAALHLLAEGL